jgi:hypothetical protein
MTRAAADGVPQQEADPYAVADGGRDFVSRSSSTHLAAAAAERGRYADIRIGPRSHKNRAGATNNSEEILPGGG